MFDTETWKVGKDQSYRIATIFAGNTHKLYFYLSCGELLM